MEKFHEDKLPPIHSQFSAPINVPVIIDVPYLEKAILIIPPKWRPGWSISCDGDIIRTKAEETKNYFIKEIRRICSYISLEGYVTEWKYYEDWRERVELTAEQVQALRQQAQAEIEQAFHEEYPDSPFPGDHPDWQPEYPYYATHTQKRVFESFTPARVKWNPEIY